MSSELLYQLKKRDDRAFENPFHEKSSNGELVDSDVCDISNSSVLKSVEESIKQAVNYLFTKWEVSIASESTSDYSVYTGVSGYALLYWHLGNLQNNESFFKLGFKLAKEALAKSKGHRFAFLTGDGGPLTLCALFAHRLNLADERDRYLQELEETYMSRSVLTQDSDELLYGKVGCLYSLLSLRKHIGRESVDSRLISSLVDAVIDSGQRLAREETQKGHRTPPLYYQWHDKVYFAAAHGMAGIFFILFQAREFLDDRVLHELIRPSLDYLLEHQFPSGNFPSSAANTSDRLVQWCHGAPGFVHCLTAAAQIYQCDAYLKAAEKCAHVVWQRGLLQKGYGLCHGVAGNAYAFINLFQFTKNPLYLHRALKFAQFCCDYGKHGCRTPDRPYSLFEGLAGTIYFLADMENPLTAKFPGYQV